MLLQSEFEMFPNTSMRDYFEESDPSSTPEEINDFKVVMEGLVGILETEFAENLNKIPAAAILGSGESGPNTQLTRS